MVCVAEPELSSSESEDDSVHLEENQNSSTIISKDGNIVWKRQPLQQSTGRRTVCNIVRSQRGPTRYAIRNIDTIASAFQLFMNNNISETIIKYTNQEGARVFKKEWIPLDKKEFDRFLGCLLLIGVYKSKNEAVTELWSHENGRPVFNKTMPRNRFTSLLRVLRFDDAAKRRREKLPDKMSPIRKVFEAWTDTLQMCYNVGENVTVDEQLVTFRGNCPFRQYIPSKPGKYGLKFWACCDSETAYVCNIQLYTGKQKGEPREQNQGTRVVMDMVKNLEKSGRNVTCDNFFTSFILGNHLKQKNLTVLGTIRKNRKEIPQQLLTTKGRQKNTSLFAFNEHGTMVSYVPRKGKVVTLFSTMHDQPEVDNTREDKKPIMILDYNKTKGGMDTADQLVRVYSCKRMSRRWPNIVFYNMLDISALNSYIIWMHLNPNFGEKKTHKRRLFLRQLASELIHKHDEPASKRKLDTTSSTSSEGQRKRARCSFCPRAEDKKVRDKCEKCEKFICGNHLKQLCHKCV